MPASASRRCRASGGVGGFGVAAGAVGVDLGAADLPADQGQLLALVLRGPFHLAGERRAARRAAARRCARPCRRAGGRGLRRRPATWRAAAGPHAGWAGARSARAGGRGPTSPGRRRPGRPCAPTRPGPPGARGPGQGLAPTAGCARRRAHPAAAAGRSSPRPAPPSTGRCPVRPCCRSAPPMAGRLGAGMPAVCCRMRQSSTLATESASSSLPGGDRAVQRGGPVDPGRLGLPQCPPQPSWRPGPRAPPGPGPRPGRRGRRPRTAASRPCSAARSIAARARPAGPHPDQSASRKSVADSWRPSRSRHIPSTDSAVIAPASSPGPSATAGEPGAFAGQHVVPGQFRVRPRAGPGVGELPPADHVRLVVLPAAGQRHVHRLPVLLPGDHRDSRIDRPALRRVERSPHMPAAPTSTGKSGSARTAPTTARPRSPGHGPSAAPPEPEARSRPCRCSTIRSTSRLASFRPSSPASTRLSFLRAMIQSPALAR